MKLPVLPFPLALAAVLLAASPVTSDPTPPPIPRIEVPECQKLAAEGRAVLVDVRDSTAYFGNHIAGALSIPLDTVAEKAGELKKSGKKIIAYCS
jgi:3-mercaptopyruvate sulfurtransferase SseA